MARYHLAVAYFTKGDWNQAAREFKTITLKTLPRIIILDYLIKTPENWKKPQLVLRNLELEPHNQRAKRELENLEN